MTTQLPTDWPDRVKQAARRGGDLGVVLDLLKKHDPEKLREQGLDATARAAHYAQRLEDLAQAA